MKILVLTCLDPTKIGLKTSGCLSSQRIWQEIDIPNATFWTQLIETFDQTYFTLILTASFTGISIGFASGLILNVIRRGRSLL